MKFEELLEAQIKRVDEDLDLAIDIGRTALAGLVGLTAGALFMKRATRRKMEQAYQQSPVEITAQIKKEVSLAMGLTQKQYEVLSAGAILYFESSYIDLSSPEGDDLTNYAASEVASVLRVASKTKIPPKGIVSKSNKRLIQQLGGDLGNANLIAAHVFMELMDDAERFAKMMGGRAISSVDERILQQQFNEIISDMKRQRVIV